jgi:hypothetical protein
VLALASTGCTSIGPGTVPHDRIDYASSIGYSWKDQTLLNIVKLRYADVPIFLEVTQVVAGYQLQTTIGASFAGGNFNASQIGPFTTLGTASAAGTYTDRPTVIYSPLTGVDFLKRLMTPIPPSSVLFLLQSGFAAQRVMPIMVDSINGLNNRSNRLNRPADPGFTRLIELIQEGQLAGALQYRIEGANEGSKNSVFVFGPSKDPKIAAEVQEIRKLLGLKPDIKELSVNYGGYSGKDDEIDMATRSMLQIMLEFAAIVEVPASDVTDGRASPGPVGQQPNQPRLRILSGDAQPSDAYVAVQYGGRWFWIANTDIQSKLTFGVVIMLFSIADTGTRGAAPVVTVPANQ